MTVSKQPDEKNTLKGAIANLTIRTFVRAAIVTNLTVAPLVFVDFSIISFINRDGKLFKIGLWLVPFVTLVIWSSASLLYLAALTLGWLRMLRRPMSEGSTRISPPDRSAVWDDWLDGPKPLGP